MDRRQLFVQFFAILTGISAIAAAAESTEKPAGAVKIVLVGDSTVQDSSGWGTGFKKLLKPEVVCVNWAKGGRSSKSFINEGLWKKALAEKPDYVLIQFGHNDQPGKGPERETDPATTFPEWMSHYIDESRAIGAKPILITSLARRTFDKNGKVTSTLTPWADATKKLGASKDVPVIDLHQRSIEELEKIGLTTAMEYDAAPVAKNGQKPSRDATHLNAKGADATAKLIAAELKKILPDLAAKIFQQ